MSTLALALSLVMVAQESAPPSPADLGGNSAADSPADDVDPRRPEPAATQGEDPAVAADTDPDEPAPAASSRAGTRAISDLGRVGLGMIATGAVVATSTAASATLIEAVTRNDVDVNAPPDNPLLVQVGGFATLTLMSLSAGAMLIGSALIVNDVLTPAAPDSAGAE